MKATFIKKAWNENDGYNSPVYEYEYRGHRYTVVDHKNGYSETMASQHKYEQSRIDKVINNKSKQKESNSKPFDFNEIWETLGWD